MVIYANNLVHITKMADTPLCGKTLQKSSSPEPVGQFLGNLIYMASGMLAHHSWYNAKVKFGHLAF